MITASIICALGCLWDKLIAHIGPLERWIESLPLGESE